MPHRHVDVNVDTVLSVAELNMGGVFLSLVRYNEKHDVHIRILLLVLCGLHCYIKAVYESLKTQCASVENN